MKLYRFMGVMAFAGMAAMSAKMASAADTGGGMGTVNDGNTAFAIELFDRVAALGSNAFLSPYSISSALGMTAAGARGKTADEMNKVLHLSDVAQFQAGMAGLNEQINGKDGAKRPYELAVANALWADQAFPLDAGFVASTMKTYGAAGVFGVDFLHNAEVARSRINGWVESQTHEKIKNLIPVRAVDASTLLVLTNAIYFKGTWATPFSKDATTDQPFHVSATKDVDVPLMKAPRSTGFTYMETDDFQALSLPYKSAVDGVTLPGGDKVPTELSMLVILPKKVDGLAAVEKSVTPENLTKWTGALQRKTGMEVFLPRFTMTGSFELSKALQEMGMKAAFTHDADFSGISDSAAGKLWISAVIHRAFVDVNEEGTEAAAATGVVMVGSAMRPQNQIITFRADHPFMFLIRHEASGTVLFMGHVVNPKE